MSRIVFEGSSVSIKGVLPVDMAKGSGNQNPNKNPPISPYRTATTGVDPDSHNTVFAYDRIENTGLYLDGRSMVIPVHFELSRMLPEKPLSLREQLDPFLIRSLVEQNPRASLRELCEQVQYQTGVILSPTSMCKILLRFGLTIKVRQQLAVRNIHNRLAT